MGSRNLRSSCLVWHFRVRLRGRCQGSARSLYVLQSLVADNAEAEALSYEVLLFPRGPANEVSFLSSPSTYSYLYHLDRLQRWKVSFESTLSSQSQCIHSMNFHIAPFTSTLPCTETIAKSTDPRTTRIRTAAQSAPRATSQQRDHSVQNSKLSKRDVRHTVQQPHLEGAGRDDR